MRGRRKAPGAGGTAAADAISSFLDAVVPAEHRRDPDLAGTPARVAEAWLDDLLAGYRQDPSSILAGAMPARGHDLVAVTGIDFHSMCPHHLLPSRGVAHVAYLPGKQVVGFGQLARLVDCFAHRLVLEEVVARQVAEALVVHLGARGAACILDAEQSCLTVRGERRRNARAHSQCFLGALADDGPLQRRFLALTRSSSGSGSHPPSPPAGEKVGVRGSSSRSRSRTGSWSRRGAG
ncbi:MAG TPA: GTP cyclohydrolase I [Anaeromyxobacteraceae bacterium]|nr:GTP cyclohydrolase I [Anaeromyxobacteraceae bacterium]